MSAVTQHPRAVELVERGKLRKQVARAVSRLIAILDELDTDPEAEPWLGASEASVIAPQWPCSSANDDREEEDEHGTEIDHGELDHAEHGIADQDGLAEQWNGFVAGIGGSGYAE